MTAELTSEQIVTKLLSEHQILKRTKENFYISNSSGSLGEYLLRLPLEEYTSQEDLIQESSAKDSRFSFISGTWNV